MSSLLAPPFQRRAEASKDLPESAAASTADLSGAASDLIKSYTNKLSSVKTSGVLRQAIMMGLATLIALLLYFLMRSRVRSNPYLAPRSELAQRLDDRVSDGRWLSKQKSQSKSKSKPNKAALAAEFTKELKERSDKRAETRQKSLATWRGRLWHGIIEAWFALRQTEELHLMQSGLDSVVYLRLLWLNVTAFSAISLCTFPLLSWVDWKAHNKGELWSNVKLAKIELNDFSITGVEDRTLYWHVFAAYIITASFCGIIYWNSLQVEKHRIEFLCNPVYLDRKEDLYKRCVMIADLTREDVELRNFQMIVNGQVKRMNLVEYEVRKKINDIEQTNDRWHLTVTLAARDPEKTEEYMEARNDLITHLQRTLTRYLQRKEGLRAKDRQALEERKERAKKAGRKKGTKAVKPYKSKAERLKYEIIPPSAWLTGRKQLALPWFKKSLLTLHQDVKVDQTKIVYYAIVAFRSVGSASIFLQQCASTSGKVRLNGWELDFAPTPSGIIWRNIGLAAEVRVTSYAVGYIALAALLLIYSLPLVFIALLSNVDAALVRLPSLKRLRDASPFLFVAATTTLPPAASAALFSLAPIAIEYVATKQGTKTVRALQHRTMHWYLAFLILSQLVLLPCSSTIWTLIVQDLDKSVKQKTQDHWLLKVWVNIVFFFSQIPTTYQTQANYWLNWLALRWLINTVQLVQMGWIFQQWLYKVFKRFTGREHVSGNCPPDYTIRIPNNMFLTVLGLLYAPLVPFVPPFLTLALAIQYCVHKVQAKVLYETVAETSGRFWLPEMDRLLLFMLLSHGCLALTCALQMADGKIAVVIAPAGFAVICFRFYLRSRFNPTLLLMLHKNAKVKTSFEPDPTEVQVRQCFKSGRPAIQFQLDRKSLGDDLADEGEKMMMEHDLQPLYEYTDETVKKEKRLYNNERNVPYRTKWNNSSATLVNPSTVVAAASRGSGSMPTSGNIEALAGSKGSGGSHAKQRKAPTRNQSKDKPPEPLS